MASWDKPRDTSEEQLLRAEANALRASYDDDPAYLAYLEDQQQSEVDAENAWLRAAEYDPRMSNPREW